ncbi:MAG: NusA antitermination factor, utilization substance protein [Patescibacteria group bacterium]|jgi:N utilization substance protein A|nr:NusA antitermination factor, utilization substance protein [Patescibacteria group bacterium]
MSLSPFTAAIQQICSEKGISEERVIETVEAALAAAYRKDFGKPSQNIRVTMGGDTTGFKVQQVFTVVENEEFLEDPEREMLIEDAKKLDKKAEVGGEVTIDLPYHDEFGRIAAQTAKQVIVQRLREAERDVLFEEFKEKEHVLLNGTVQQMDMDTAIISLGKVNAVMPPREQIRGEHYTTGQRVKVFVKEVAESSRGPQIIVSRTDSRFIKELFALEVPEIPAGTVEIKSLSREAGSRTKMAVYSSNPSLDPVGSCVGQRGTRVQAVLAEVGDEKIDIILWNEDSEQFIRNALSPAKVRSITLDNEKMHALVNVDNDQLSLAIGKGGQNVRLASKLTGYTLDIVRDEEETAPSEETAPTETPEATPEESAE